PSFQARQGPFWDPPGVPPVGTALVPPLPPDTAPSQGVALRHPIDRGPFYRPEGTLGGFIPVHIDASLTQADATIEAAASPQPARAPPAPPPLPYGLDFAVRPGALFRPGPGGFIPVHVDANLVQADATLIAAASPQTATAATAPPPLPRAMDFPVREGPFFTPLLYPQPPPIAGGPVNIDGNLTQADATLSATTALTVGASATLTQSDATIEAAASPQAATVATAPPPPAK